MDGHLNKLTVSISTVAQASLDEIWEWNARNYSRDHAQKYIDFLHVETEKLGTSYARGKQVSQRPHFRYVTIKRKKRGHGHIAIYRIMEDAVIVLDYFHTAEDWRNKLSELED